MATDIGRKVTFRGAEATVIGRVQVFTEFDGPWSEGDTGFFLIYATIGWEPSDHDFDTNSSQIVFHEQWFGEEFRFVREEEPYVHGDDTRTLFDSVQLLLPIVYQGNLVKFQEEHFVLQPSQFEGRYIVVDSQAVAD